MKLLTAVSTLLLAGTALAAPGTALRRDRALKRRVGHKGNPLLRPDISVDLATNITHDVASTNWAGAVLVGKGYTSVTGTFTVPTLSTDGSGSVSFLYLGNPILFCTLACSLPKKFQIIQEPLTNCRSDLGWHRRLYMPNRNPANRHRLDQIRLQNHLRCLV